MAQVEQLPPDVLAAVAEQIGARLTEQARTAISRGAAMEIAESFPVYMLPLEATTVSGLDISDLAVPTGLWHHQVRQGQAVRQFARSMPTGPRAADWRVEEFVASPIAKSIDDAAHWLDNHVVSHAQVRLLIVPAYQIHAFWLFEPDDNKILVVDRPPIYGVMEYQRIYSAADFLAVLRQLPHAAGMPRRH
jgi:hypothetical protein